MKRDMDLVRNILLEVEQPNDYLKGHTEAKIAYHVLLMETAEFLTLKDKDEGDDVGTALCALTWYGHEVLDLIRCEPVWILAKKVASDTGNESFSCVRDIAQQVSKGMAERIVGSMVEDMYEELKAKSNGDNGHATQAGE